LRSFTSFRMTVKSGSAIASSKCLPNRRRGSLSAPPSLLFAAPAAGNYLISIILGASKISGGFGKIVAILIVPQAGKNSFPAKSVLRWF
jgi:hypothetical protein